MKKLHCDLCDAVINDSNGEPYINFKNKSICSQCALDLISTIYGFNDCVGGLIHIAFKEIVKSKK